MTRLLRNARRTLFSSCAKNFTGELRQLPSIQSRHAIPTSLFPSRSYSTGKITKSPFDSNILRILRNEIEYQHDYAPPHQTATKFNSFTVQDRPGEQWMMMEGKYGDTEDIKIEVTMFDGFITFPETGDDSTKGDVRLHISVLVDITKVDGSHALEFVCSAWPDCLEIQKVYILGQDKMLARPYLGPDFRNLNGKLQRKLHEFLDARGVNDQLSVFLHECMMNKDRTELIRWLERVKAFVET